MKISSCLSVALAFLLISVDALGAATILGKVASYSSPSRPNTYPLLSGSKVTCDYRTLIKIKGGALIADKGAVIEAFDEGDRVVFRIDKGSIHFRVLPHEAMVSFRALPGEASSPRVSPASDSIVSGRITVTDRRAVLEVAEGSLDVVPSYGYSVVEVSGGPLDVTPNGLNKVSAGQSIVLAQAEVEETPKEGVTGATTGGISIPLTGAAIVTGGVFIGGSILLGTTLEEGEEASPIE